ncbi:ZF-HD homeobox protein [Theobroma cacao]|uniref:ZF-HD dimerization-type domain-containing protein n=1 Tax=Theobroma cacao TaxID=3641 RepID=A0A061DXS4_THECC|nr:Uncharacterized protein TCM_006254 [Theobroma cacao]WRX13317.1 ZF-HD homeobox protein [Theobroma cacao]
MEKARNSPDQINNVADIQARAGSGQGINPGSHVVEQGATYMECRRNYVASIGGYIIDGCPKFVEGGHDDEIKEALLCATCGCHRSFHRKVVLPPPHLRDTRYSIMNYLRSLPLAALQPRPPTPWLMQSPILPNCELIEGQGSSTSPDESESDSGDEINQASKINKAG